jgi:Uma2 family endonuclease
LATAPWPSRAHRQRDVRGAGRRVAGHRTAADSTGYRGARAPDATPRINDAVARAVAGLDLASRPPKADAMLTPMLAPEPDRLRPLRLDEFDRLVAAGCFADEHVELLDGALVEMSPQGDAHVWVTGRIQRALILALGPGFDVYGHSPITALPGSVPEPDVYVVPARTAPGLRPSATLLVIEVADTSLHKDRTRKARIYARAGFPEYWLFNLNAGTVEVRTQPGPDGYQTLVTVTRDATLTPTLLPGVDLAVTDLLPPPA